MYKLAVVIVNYCTPDLVIACVESVVSQLPDNACVVVVDNGSGDRSVERLEATISHRKWDAVHLLPSPRNLGFGGGNNLGIQAVDADYYLLLNSDTLLKDGAIPSLLGTLEAHHDVGLCGPKIVDEQGEQRVSCFRWATPLSELVNAAQTGIVTAAFKRSSVPLPFEDHRRPQWMSFACIMIRNTVFQTVGLLDPDFFMYYEDMDFCRRAAEDGWKLKYVEEAQVVHYEGKSSGVAAAKKKLTALPKYYFAARTRYYAKVYGSLGPWLANGCWLAGKSLATLRALLGKPTPGTPEGCWKGIWTNCFSPLASPGATENIRDVYYRVLKDYRLDMPKKDAVK